jgi:uncharacterized protein YkwD
MHAALLLLPLALAGTPEKGPASPERQAAEEILRLANKLRAGPGRPALAEDPRLNRAAQKHAENMARKGVMVHQLGGKGPGDRIAAEGYAATLYAENIGVVGGPAAGVAAAALRGWSRSPAHRKNLLAKSPTQSGVGVARGGDGRWYLCQVFAVPKGSEPTLRCSLANRTSGAVRLRVGQSVIAIPAGASGTLKIAAEGAAECRVEPAAGGPGVTFTPRAGARYAVTEAGGKLKVIEVK